jgi:hypothetical protein
MYVCLYLIHLSYEEEAKRVTPFSLSIALFLSSLLRGFSYVAVLRACPHLFFSSGMEEKELPVLLVAIFVSHSHLRCQTTSFAPS